MFKIDFTKYNKLTLIILAALLVVGIAFFFIFGFNQGIEFSGGTEINVNIGKEASPEASETINDIIARELGSKYVSSVTQSSLNYKVAIIRTDCGPLTTAQTDKLIAALESEFGFDRTAVECEIYEVSPTLNASFYKTGLISFAVALAFISVYMLFRYSLTAVVAFVLAAKLNVFIILTLYLLTRSTLTSGLAIVVFISLILTTNATALLFERMKEIKKRTGNKVTFKEMAVEGVSDSLTTTLLTLVAFIIVFVAIGMFISNGIDSIALPIIFAAVAQALTSLFVVGAIAVAFDNKFPNVKPFKGKNKK